MGHSEGLNPEETHEILDTCLTLIRLIMKIHQWFKLLVEQILIILPYRWNAKTISHSTLAQAASFPSMGAVITFTFQGGASLQLVPQAHSSPSQDPKGPLVHKILITCSKKILFPKGQKWAKNAHIHPAGPTSSQNLLQPQDLSPTCVLNTGAVYRLCPPGAFLLQEKGS